MIAFLLANYDTNDPAEKASFEFMLRINLSTRANRNSISQHKNVAPEFMRTLSPVLRANMQRQVPLPLSRKNGPGTRQ